MSKSLSRGLGWSWWARERWDLRVRVSRDGIPGGDASCEQRLGGWKAGGKQWRLMRIKGAEASWNQALNAWTFSLSCGALSRVYSHIQLASKLSSGCDYALFKVSSASPAPTPGTGVPQRLPHCSFTGSSGMGC